MNHASVNSQRTKILVVEDSRSIHRELGRRITKYFDFDVHIAENYAQTKELLDEFSPEIFLAIADVNLPDAPRGEVVDLIRARAVPCMVITSDMTKETRARMLTKDIADYIIKDIHAVDKVVRYIRRLMRNRTMTVLVVEDSSSFRLHLCSLLHRQMFRVEDVNNAEDALKYIAENDDVQVVITDFVLPGMDGVELTRKLRTRFSKEEMAIIGISTSTNEMLGARFIKIGANDFIPKPFSMEEFHHRVNHTVEIMDTFNELHKANEVKDRFVGMVVHDLRSPINGINGLSEMLLQGMCGELNEEQLELIGFINEANKNMEHMVRDLLDISMINIGKLVLVKSDWNLKELLERRLSMHAIAAKQKSITLETELEDVGVFSFDAGRVGQVIDNLMTNAIKFSPVGETVRVLLKKEGEMVCVRVCDHGEGVPPGEENLLFESFKKTSVRPTAGETSHGLGLSIVMSVIKAHGGMVGVESEFGKGAEFYFKLPMKKSS